jgi:hypothetical protein
MLKLFIIIQEWHVMAQNYGAKIFGFGGLLNKF